MAIRESGSGIEQAADAHPGRAWELERIVAELKAARVQWRIGQGRSTETGGRELPSREALRDIVALLCGVLFPMRLGPADLREESEDFYVGHTLDAALHALLAQARLELHYTARQQGRSDEDTEARAQLVVHDFAAALPRLRILLDTDVVAAYEGDPAAHSVDEVLLCYPGIHAVIHHRLAHQLHITGLPLIARVIAEIAHAETGIDIHPGARIGSGFFIDHGTGVVIGETAVIGKRVRIYQAVTLGAKRFNVGEDGVLEKGALRHPILEDDVVVYAGATILGRITIGRGSSIGGNVWLTRSVPPGSVITQASSQHELAERKA
ncbi:MAG TPA: serine O-acetyltransferase EpsC [Gallionella sp.]|nr:serine O-acetyltransferase EpsC [Gallionella sp.]